MNVLIVEDNILVARIQQGFMKKVVPKFARVDVAESCEETKNLIKKYTYEIILVDFGLPDGHGLDLVSYLREQGLRSLIVAVSGNLGEKSKKERSASGLDWGYQKPLLEEHVKDILLRYEKKFGLI